MIKLPCYSVHPPLTSLRDGDSTIACLRHYRWNALQISPRCDSSSTSPEKKGEKKGEHFGQQMSAISGPHLFHLRKSPVRLLLC